jgi:hypothetical protein
MNEHSILLQTLVSCFHKKFYNLDVRFHLGNSVVLYTTDGNSDNFVRCGKTSVSTIENFFLAYGGIEIS